MLLSVCSCCTHRKRKQNSYNILTVLHVTACTRTYIHSGIMKTRSADANWDSFTEWMKWSNACHCSQHLGLTAAASVRIPLGGQLDVGVWLGGGRLWGDDVDGAVLVLLDDALVVGVVGRCGQVGDRLRLDALEVDVSTLRFLLLPRHADERTLHVVVDHWNGESVRWNNLSFQKQNGLLISLCNSCLS